MDKEGVVHIYIMEYYSTTKRHVTGSFVERWVDLEYVIRSEVIQRKNKYHILMHTCGI